jgi:lysophospholipid acyltransferase (LPLAT)-like uncharacterized protein
MVRAYIPVSTKTWKPRLLGWIIASLMKAWVLTLRFRYRDEAGYTPRGPHDNVIWAFWHNRIFVMPHAFKVLSRQRRPGAVLTSPSGDGAILAAVMEQFGLTAIRGSSNKRAAQALVECRRHLRDHHADLAITPDGPRGPVHVVAPGVIQLSRVAHRPIMPVTVHYENAWTLRKTWDQFAIPSPFSKVTVILHPLIETPGDDLEAGCRHLEKVLAAPLG